MYFYSTRQTNQKVTSGGIMKKKIADSLLSSPKQKPVQMNSEQSEREELMSQVLESDAVTAAAVEIQKDKYLLEGK